MVAVLGLAEGCTLAKISGRGAIPIMFNNPPTRVQLVRSVEVKKMRAFDWTASFDVSEVLGDVIAMTDADAIINVAITVRSMPLDWIVNMLTLGLANSRTMYITGDVVRVRDGGDVVSLPPAGSEPVASADSLGAVFTAAIDHPAETGYSNAIVTDHSGECDARYSLVKCRADAFEICGSSD
jgi:hypothetical protein